MIYWLIEEKRRRSADFKNSVEINNKENRPPLQRAETGF